MSLNYDAEKAATAINKIFNAAQKQASNAKNFSNELEELASYFSGEVSQNFFSKATSHCSDLATVASNVSNVADGFSKISNTANTNFRNISRGGV